MKKPSKTVKVKKLDTAQVVSNAVYTYIKNKKGLCSPTHQDIAELTGLSLSTVERHYKNIQFEPSKLPQRALTPIVVNNLLAQTSKSTQAVKLWFQLMEGWRENADVDTSNNTLKIEHTFVDKKDDDDLDFTL